jgi:acetolactate synthase-1/2/3 large subunit
MIKLSDYVISFLQKQGVKHVFLLPGGGCMHLVDSLGKSRKIEYVCCLHEQAAAIAAEAQGQYTNNLGVVLVTTGPGSTNTITAVAGAWIDSTALLVISGQVKRRDMIKYSKLRQMGVQEVDIVSIIKPITKYATTILNPKEIKYQLEKAVYLAKTGKPGPVWLDIPLDVQGALIEERQLRGFKPPKPKIQNQELSSLIRKVINLLNNSTRPVILVGNGVRIAGGLKDFLKLIRILNIPVLTTWKSIDFLPEKDRLFFGRPGSIGQRGANFIQQNSDLIITLGARLDLPQVGYSYANFARSAKKVIVDIDPAEIKKLKMKVDVAASFDAKLFIREFIKQKDSLRLLKRVGWIKRCREWRNKYSVVLPKYARVKKYVNTYFLVDVLSRLMSKKDLLVLGSSGSCSEIPMQSFKVKNGQRIINTPGLGSMGFGLPASIGACLASGRRRTIAVIGDGGLQHNIQELETLARLKLPIKIFILNNNGYASIRNTQKSYFKGHYVCCDPTSGLTLPDTCKVAAAYGIKNIKIFNHLGIVDPYLQTAPRLSSQVLPDGSIVSKSLEDLWPFLDREEFRSNMIVPHKKN